ncbi:MAG TPA: hypothetical protein VF591_02135, partial [Pyrinomonadaceae bacterium]
MELHERIPNNVNLSGDKRLQRALEKWLPNYLDWWREMGPEGFQDKDVWLRTAVSVEADGWAHFDYVRMPDYRWGIFLKPAEPDARVGFGDNMGQPAYQEVPGEFRNALRRIVVTQADTEPASVEQQRRLGQTCPSLYDLRNLFQVNVEEGRHLWAMVYLLHGYFGRDGRDEADALLERRSGNPDKPRILEAFNQPCDDWLNFFCFTMFTDRDGKYQLSALAESGFEPLARTCQFMLTEEAHHLFVGETGVGRVRADLAAEEVERVGEPVVDVALDDVERDAAQSAHVLVRVLLHQLRGAADDAPHAGLADEEVVRLLRQHELAGARERLEARLGERRELVLAVAVGEHREAEEVEPVVARLVEGFEYAGLVRVAGAPFEQGVGLVAPVAAEVAVQQVDHRPEVSALLDVHLKQIAQVVERGAGLSQTALLLDRGGLGVGLRDDDAA